MYLEELYNFIYIETGRILFDNKQTEQHPIVIQIEQMVSLHQETLT